MIKNNCLGEKNLQIARSSFWKGLDNFFLISLESNRHNRIV